MVITRTAARAALLRALPAALVALSLAAPAAGQDYKVISANLYGKGVAGGGAADEGSADFDGEIDFREGRLCFYLDLYDIGDPTEVHIHKGEESDESGPVALTLPVPAEPGDETCAPGSGELLRAIAAQPAEYYVDVHTARHPDGALRGQFKD